MQGLIIEKIKKKKPQKRSNLTRRYRKIIHNQKESYLKEVCYERIK